MSKFKFINVVDTFFIALAIMLIVFAWLQFFIKNIAISIMLSAVTSLAIMFFIRHVKSKKQIKYISNESKNTEILKFKLAIQTLPNNKLVALIKQLVPTQYETKTLKDGISFVKDGYSHTITFNFDGELTESNLLKIIKTNPSNHITICCLQFNNEVKYVCNSFKNKYINLINADQLYELFMRNNIYVDTSNIDLSKHKISVREIFKNAVLRNKSKGYFISGLVLLFTSLIIPYKIYYVVFSTILFALSLICRFKPNNTSATKGLID